jgi:hypothetical protein
MSPVKYELGFYIPEDGILHSHRREKLRFYKVNKFSCSIKYWNFVEYLSDLGKPEGKRPLGRSRRRWIDNIKMDLLDTGMSVVDWIGLAQDRYMWRALVNSVMNLQVP